MKAKLLKEARAVFKIEYYPHTSGKKYKLTDTSYSFSMSPYLTIWHFSIESAKRNIVTCLRAKYFKYSRKHKLSKVKTKVWYNVK